MKVLFIASYSGTSGANHSLVKLISYLRDNFGIDPYVIIPNQGPIEKMLIKENINFTKIKLYTWIEEINSKNIDNVKWIIQKNINYINEKKIKRILIEKNIDILHINASTVNWGFKSANSLNIPVIWHIREFLEEDLSKKFRNKNLSYEQLRKADRIIAISKSIEEKYKNQLYSNNIEQVYNGIDTIEYQDSLNYINFNTTTVLTIAGRIVPKKGQIDAIEAVKILKDRGYRLKLQIVGSEGDASYTNNLHKLVKKYNLESEVFFLGYVENMSKIWKESDIALICSTYEAFGRVTIEGMLGCSFVVGTNTAGTKELIGNNEYGYLYEVGNSQDLADKIENVIRNPEKSKKTIQKSYYYATENFSAYSNAKDIYKIYYDIK